METKAPDMKPTASQMNVSNNVARNVQNHAAIVAKVLDMEPFIAVEMADTIAAGEKVKLSPLAIMFLLGDVFDSPNNDTDMTLADFPVPDTTEKDVEGTNRMPDKYTDFVPSPTGSGATAEKGSFYNKLFGNLTFGKEIERKLSGFKLAKNGSIDTPEEFVKYRNHKDATEFAKLYESRRDRGRKMLKDAMRIYFQQSMIEEVMGNKVSVSYKAGTDDDGKPRIKPDTNSPIIVGSLTDSRAFTDMTVVEFLKLQPKNCIMANPNAGYEELMVFHKVPRDEKSDKDKIIPKDYDGVMRLMRPLAEALAVRSDVSIYRDVIKTFSGKDAPEKIKAFGDAYLELEGVWNTIKLRYSQYIDAEARELDAKAAKSKEDALKSA